MATIPKNTNKAKKVIANAHDIRCYSLSNNFHPQPVEEKISVWGLSPEGNHTVVGYITPAEFLAKELQETRSAKLTGSPDCSRYMLRIHSNLWYEFEVRL